METLNHLIPHDIQQLIVLGGGIESADSRLPGAIQPDSEGSRSSYERAVETGYVMRENPNLDTVLFCGRTSYMMSEEEEPDVAESEAMENVALSIFENLEPVKVVERAKVDTYVDVWSRTTIGNFVAAARARRRHTQLPADDFIENWIDSISDRKPPLVIDPNRRTGILTDLKHAERALKIARFVMPHTDFVIVPADRTEQSEAGPSGIHEFVANALFRISMLGVEAGDLDKIEKRDRITQQSVLLAKKILSPALGIRNKLRGATQNQLVQAA